MKTIPVLSFMVLAAISGFGQDAKTSMSPTEVVAGKNTTFTLIVDKAPSVQDVSFYLIVAPKDPKDNAGAFRVNLGRKNGDFRVYSAEQMVPPTAKGIWYIKEAAVVLPVSNDVSPVEINHPEFTIKSIEITLPKTGKVEITAQ